jgi:hypothetical protein
MDIGRDEVVMVVVYSLIILLVLVPLVLELGKRRGRMRLGTKSEISA